MLEVVGSFRGSRSYLWLAIEIKRTHANVGDLVSLMSPLHGFSNHNHFTIHHLSCSSISLVLLRADCPGVSE